MHVLDQALGWYVAHAWVSMDNPSGVFADWNPDVAELTLADFDRVESLSHAGALHSPPLTARRLKVGGV